MKHCMWLENRTETWALDRKTPYEMVHNWKPFLAGIFEFGVVAYVKDLQARKLEEHAWKGYFVRYNSESKGYWIY
jgi:hypothetical protein